MNIYHIKALFFNIHPQIYIPTLNLPAFKGVNKIGKYFYVKKAQSTSFKKLQTFKRINFQRLYLCNQRFCFLFLMQVAIMHESIGCKKT